MQEPDLLPAPPHIIGPTWQKLREGGFWLPKRNETLGDQVVNWLATYVLQPGGPRAGEAFIPTNEQYRFLLWWFALDPETGRFIYRNGLLRRLKGWGKDPLVAALSLIELCGPVQFSHFDLETGLPVGKPKPQAWVQIAAVSQDQTRNTFTLFPAMISPKLKEEYGLDVNKTIIYTKTGGMIEGVTSSPLALEGKRPTFVVMNEVQWWLESNDGHAMYDVIDGNVTKAAFGQCRYLAICNAHRPGEESIGERLFDNWQAVQGGNAVDTGLLYDALEAPADTPVSEIPSEKDDAEGFAEGVEKLKAGLRVARGDAVWLDIEGIVASILDSNNSITESKRKFLNQINASEDSFVSPAEWGACFAPVKLEPGDRITLGFDGSKSNDWTALVACRVEDGALFVLRVWDPEKQPTGEIPRDQVDAVVRSAFERYEVVSFRADVHEFEAYVDQWSRDFKRKLKVNASPNNPVAYDMRGQKKRFSLDVERFLDAVLEKELCHDGDKTLASHITNAYREPTNYDTITIRKATKDSSRKIDAAVCAILAFGARQEFLMSKKNRSGRAAVLKA